MAFDVHQVMFDEDGECDDEAFAAYVSVVMEAFEESPEGKDLAEIAWMDIVLDYGRSYFGATAATLQPGEFAEIVWEIIPRKVSVDAAEGPAIIRELRAFWAFAGREFVLPHAAACQAVVGEGAEARLEQYLGDRRRHGMAKSLFMGGKAAGFDVNSAAGVESLMAAYNSSILRSHAELARSGVAANADARRESERKAKRKREKAARKKSRR